MWSWKQTHPFTKSKSVNAIRKVYQIPRCRSERRNVNQYNEVKYRMPTPSFCQLIFCCTSWAARLPSCYTLQIRMQLWGRVSPAQRNTTEKQPPVHVHVHCKAQSSLPRGPDWPETITSLKLGLAFPNQGCMLIAHCDYSKLCLASFRLHWQFNHTLYH